MSEEEMRDRIGMLMGVIGRRRATITEAFRAAYAGEEMTEKQMNIVAKIMEGGESGRATVKDKWQKRFDLLVDYKKEMVTAMCHEAIKTWVIG